MWRSPVGGMTEKMAKGGGGRGRRTGGEKGDWRIACAAEVEGQGGGGYLG